MIVIVSGTVWIKMRWRLISGGTMMGTGNQCGVDDCLPVLHGWMLLSNRCHFFAGKDENVSFLPIVKSFVYTPVL